MALTLILTQTLGPDFAQVMSTPTGVHLAIHADQSSMVVSWVSASTRQQSAKVMEDTSDPSSEIVDLLQQILDALRPAPWISYPSTPSTYKASDMCAYPGG